MNNYISKIAVPAVQLPSWDQVEGEPQYNKRCGLTPGFLHFDSANVLFGGNQSKFEFWDLLHVKSRTLKYHPKADASWLSSRPDNGGWNLCLVSMGRPAAALPFFAKCGLGRVHKVFFASV